jgi:hypothetical protein
MRMNKTATYRLGRASEFIKLALSELGEATGLIDVPDGFDEAIEAIMELLDSTCIEIEDLASSEEESA